MLTRSSAKMRLATVPTPLQIAKRTKPRTNAITQLFLGMIIAGDERASP